MLADDDGALQSIKVGMANIAILFYYNLRDTVYALVILLRQKLATLKIRFFDFFVSFHAQNSFKKLADLEETLTNEHSFSFTIQGESIPLVQKKVAKDCRVSVYTYGKESDLIDTLEYNLMDNFIFDRIGKTLPNHGIDLLRTFLF